MFAAHEVSIPVPFGVAAERLLRLIDRDALHGTSQAAFESELEAVLRVGPFGDRRGLSKLVRVRFLKPVRAADSMTVALRWEATGAAGELFPALDADLSLTREGLDRARVALAGSYRPPFGRAGAALDRAVGQRLAAATIRSLVEGIADALARPAPPGLPEPAERTR